MDLSITCAAWDAELADAPALVRRAVDAAAVRAGTALGDHAEVSVLLADDDMLRQLNREWRGRDAATNVLSFPAFAADDIRAGAVAAAPPPALLGDIALSHETTAREARQHGKTLADHAAHLLVHGFLHLVGYDHETETQAKVMEALEVRVLADIGVDNPYHAVA